MNVKRPNISLRTFLKTKVKYLKSGSGSEIAEVKRVSGIFTMFKY